MSINAIPKEYRALIKPFLDAGVAELVTGRHLCIRRIDNKHKMPICGSPSCFRSFANQRAQLRRMFADVLAV